MEGGRWSRVKLVQSEEDGGVILGVHLEACYFSVDISRRVVNMTYDQPNSKQHWVSSIK